MKPRRILVCEDEDAIRDFVVIHLKRSGYEVYDVNCGEKAIEAWNRGLRFDVALLDIMMPGIDGCQVCRFLRERSSTIGIIMLSAKTQEMDKVNCLMMGADDYVTKPFSIKVLLARIKANIRRSSGEFVEIKQPAPAEGMIVIRELKIDTKNFRVTKGGREIELSKKEFEVLLFLASHPDELFTREELLEKVWGYEDFFGGIRTVDVTMSRLRSKIEEVPAEPEYILTKRTKGYYIPS